jgi:predicted Fe-Mo cluster-binding NifX family protein
MIVAVPVYGNEVAPRFGEATELVVAQAYEGRIHSIRRVSLGTQGTEQIYSLVVSLRPHAVICGGIRRSLQRLLEREHIAVFWGVIGRAEDALNLYLAGRLRPDQFVRPGRRGGRACGRRHKGSREGGGL